MINMDAGAMIKVSLELHWLDRIIVIRGMEEGSRSVPFEKRKGKRQYPTQVNGLWKGKCAKMAFNSRASLRPTM